VLANTRRSYERDDAAGAREAKQRYAYAGAPPFAIKVSFNTLAGMGEISETWLSGRSWRYDQSLGTYSEARVGGGGQTFAKRVGMAPMAVQMVRSAMFWPVGGNPSVNMIRSAAAEWNGKPVTVVLISGNSESIYPGRHWVETEYVIDNATGLLQIYSRAPGTFAVYSFDKRASISRSADAGSHHVFRGRRAGGRRATGEHFGSCRRRLEANEPDFRHAS